jgi:hypothetical protein
MAVMAKRGRKKRPVLSFSRALLPPSKFHTTPKGARGYRRQERRREERQARHQPDGW